MSDELDDIPKSLTLTLTIEGKCCGALQYLAKTEDVSIEFFAEQLLKKSLENSELRLLESGVQQLRGDLAFIFEVLLVKGGADAEMVRKWVAANLRCYR